MHTFFMLNSMPLLLVSPFGKQRLKSRLKNCHRWFFNRFARGIIGSCHCPGRRRKRAAFGIFTELSRRHAAKFAELPAEMFRVAIAAKPGNLRNALFRVGKEILCHSQPALNDVIHTRDSELLFVQKL